MAETVLLTIASKLLLTTSSPAFTKIKSLWKAREDLDQLRKAIGTIRACLLDAERQQESSDLVKDWLQRFRDVIYEADDLFDEIFIDNQLKKHIKWNKLLSKVKLPVHKLNSVASSKMIAKRVKDIRKSLDLISKDMTQFKFMPSFCEDPRVSIRAETGSFVDPKEVIGRDDDKEALIGMLLEGSDGGGNVSVIALTGIGGMGKTTLAQLVYNDEDVGKHFGKKWWACISDVFDEKEVARKILKSIIGEIHHDLSMDWLQIRIREAIRGKKYLLVLDDMWEEDHGRWLNLRSLLSCGAKGSYIVVTTRSSSVARATDGIKTHLLGGLTEEMSWLLFKRLAFTVEQEGDPDSIRLGKEIIKKCANVPLAIKAIGSLLYTKSSLREWEYFRSNELSKIVLSDDPIMSTLKLSYNHLPSNLKQCFAYCSLFPKDHLIEKDDLIYFWIAQGYIDSSCGKQTLEDVGHLYFMELLRRSFFKEVIKGDDGEISGCKIHDLVHDLARAMAAEESLMVTRQFDHVSDCIRHVSFDHSVHDPWTTLMKSEHAKRLRSIITIHESQIRFSAFVELVEKFRFLRALRFSGMSMEKIPTSIGELKHLRYLNISRNSRIKSLPSCITKLLNLVALDISHCGELELLPADFAKLLNLRYLNLTSCDKLSHMPPGFGKMTSLQRLSNFIVGEGGAHVKTSNLFSLARLNLRGNLTIKVLYWDASWNNEPDAKNGILLGHESLSKLRLDFEGAKIGLNEADFVLQSLQPPPSLKALEILLYPGTKMSSWGMDCFPSLLPNLSHIEVGYCLQCRYLPSFRRLPRLDTLCLDGLKELEHIEEETCTLQEPFFPSLKKLLLHRMPKLIGWSTTQPPAFPLVTSLTITDCSNLKTMPGFRLLQTLHLDTIDNDLVHLLLLKNMTLETLAILNCQEMVSLPKQGLTTIKHLEISYCPKLKFLCLPPPHLNAIEELHIWNCGELKLWEEEEIRSIDWDSLTKLRVLRLDQVPGQDSLRECLQRRSALGQLEIR